MRLQILLYTSITMQTKVTVICAGREIESLNIKYENYIPIYIILFGCSVTEMRNYKPQHRFVYFSTPI